MLYLLQAKEENTWFKYKFVTADRSLWLAHKTSSTSLWKAITKG